MYNLSIRLESRVTSLTFFACNFLSFSTESPTSVELAVMGRLATILV